MSHHNKDLYPKHNTPQIHAEMTMHGLDPFKPSQMSDVFRFGWRAALSSRSNHMLIKSLERHIEIDLSNREDMEKALEALRKIEQNEAS